MSTIHPGSPRDDADDSPFTVEDAGSTTDASDLVGGERARQGDAAFADDDVVASSGSGGGAATRVTSTEPVRSDGRSVPRDTTDGGGAHAVTGPDDPADTEPTAVSHDHAGLDHDHDHTGHDRADDAGHDHDHDHDAGSARPEGLAALDDDGSIAHVFDQTNGVIEGLEGDSDGSAESDDLSRAEREDENPDLFHDGLVRGEQADDSRSTGA